MTQDADQSLWASLHDADLIRFSSDASARTATFEVQVEHLGDESGAGSMFSIVLQAVRTIVFAQWYPWSPSDRRLDDAELMGRRDWGRMQSVDVFDFAGPYLRIHDASMRTSSASDLSPMVNCFHESSLQVLTLDIDGLGSPIGSLALSIVFERMELNRHGESITIDEFVALGEAYWDRWAARNKRDTAPE